MTKNMLLQDYPYNQNNINKFIIAGAKKDYDTVQRGDNGKKYKIKNHIKNLSKKMKFRLPPKSKYYNLVTSNNKRSSKKKRN